MSQEAPSIGPEHEDQGNDKDQANKCPDYATDQRRNHSLFSLFVGNAGHCRPERLPPETDGDRGDHDGADMKAADRNGYGADAQPARTAKHVPVAALMPMIRTRVAVKKVRLAGAECAERCNDTC